MADRKIFANAGPSDPNIRRSVFDKSFYNNLTARFGRIYPVFVEEAPANSTYKIRPAFGFSLMPMVFPIQTNVRCHIAFFKAPFRILMKNYEDYAVGVGNHVMPFISRASNWAQTGSLADYMGVPTFKATKYQVLTTVGVRAQAESIQYSYFQCGPCNIVRNTLFHDTLNHAFSVVSGSNPSLGFATRALKRLLYNRFLHIPLIGSTYPSLGSGYKVAIHLFVNGLDVDFLELSGSLSSTDTPQAATFCQGTQTGSDVRINDLWLHQYDMVLGLTDDFKQRINEFIENGDNVNLVFVTGSSNVTKFGNMVFTKDFLDTATSVTGEDSEKPVTITYFNHDGLQPFISYTTEVYLSSEDSSSPFVGVDPELKINALPFRMYEMIYNYHFRNSAVDPLVIDGTPYYNKFLTNDADGADSTTPLDFKQAMFEPDIFTTCLPSPQLGYAPLVGITFNSGDSSAVLHMQPESGDAYDVEVSVGGDSDALAINNYADVADRPTIKRLQEMINIGISINDLRNASALQRWCERRNKSGLIYHDYVFEMFGTHAPDGDHFPEYLGGYTQSVNVGKIENQAMTANAKLGEFAGTANCVGQAEEINVFCPEQSYIMGIMYFTVTPTYSQQLPAHLVKRDLLDYFNPQFINIGLQPVYNYQIAPLQADDTPGNGLRDVFGFNRPYADYVQRLDEVHGDFRKESMQNFLLQRQYGTMPHLNASFLNINSQDLTDVFAVQLDSDKIYGQIYFDVKATLPIPRFMTPQIL